MLKNLEEKSGKPAGSKKDKEINQLSLFTSIETTSVPVKESPILSDIKEIDPNTLSPLEALQKIIHWRSELHC